MSQLFLSGGQSIGVSASTLVLSVNTQDLSPSSAYLSLLIFLLAVMIPACASSSPAFHMMYSACKLNKQGDILSPKGNSLDVLLSLFGTSPLFHVWLLLLLDPHKISQEAGQVIWYSHISTVCCDPHSQSLWHSE